jgi:hypothetical protein
MKYPSSRVIGFAHEGLLFSPFVKQATMSLLDRRVDWSDAGTVHTIDAVQTRAVLAPLDEQGVQTDLLVAASGRLDIGARSGTRVHVGATHAFELYEREATTDRRLMRVRRDTNGVTRITGDTPGRLGLEDITLTRHEIPESNGTLREYTGLSTSQPNGILFPDRATFNDGVQVGDVHLSDGNTFTQSLQIWKRLHADPDAGHVEGATNLIGYQFIINDYGELQIIKSSNFNGPAPGEPGKHTNKVAAVFGTRVLLPSDTSTSQSNLLADFASRLGGDSTQPVTVVDPQSAEAKHVGYWLKSESGDGTLYTVKHIGIGTSQPQHLLHIEGDPDTQQVHSTIPIQTTSLLKCHTLMTESDERVKRDVSTIDPDAAVAAVSRMRPCSYSRTDGGSSARRVQGFIAQELLRALPSAVSVERSEHHGIDDFHYVDVMPVLANVVATLQKIMQHIGMTNDG